ncbi:Transcriptional regulatory protein TcrA [Rhodocyclaceae bacterium]|nr:Transcriptional regulatory protein TcrA [Rhodocyclaceae bacterium]
MDSALRILVVEDNPDLAANLVDFLEGHGHLADAAGDGITGLKLAAANDYDVVVLDVMLPGMDGLELCRRLRGETGKLTPILMLTARDATEDKIAGLEAGADDYVVKPFVLREVEARLKALARRAQAASPRQTLRVGDLAYDTATYRVTRGDAVLELPPIPLRLLEALMRASPRVLSRDELERTIWGDLPPDSDALRAHMHILRSAVDKPFAQPLIRTLRGLGWQMTEADAPAP